MSKTLRRLTTLAVILVVIYSLAVGTYSIVEGKSLFDACWWGLMTMTTVGYGDEYPHSALGRIMGIILVMSAVFVIVPTLTAYIASKFIVDGDEWTHDEQEEVKGNLRDVLDIVTQIRYNDTSTNERELV